MPNLATGAALASTLALSTDVPTLRTCYVQSSKVASFLSFKCLKEHDMMRQMMLLPFYCVAGLQYLQEGH